MRSQNKTAFDLIRATLMLGGLLIVAIAVLWWIGRAQSREHSWWNTMDASAPGENPNDAIAAKEKSEAGAARERLKSPHASVDDSARRSQAQSQVQAPLREGPSAAVQRAMDLIDKGQWTEAESLLSDFLKNHPRDELALIEMAMIQVLDRRDNLAAQPFLQRALQVNPQNEIVLNELLRTYGETRGWEEGLSFFKGLAGASDAANPAVSLGMGTALLELNRPQEAVDVLQRGITDGGIQSFDAHDTLAQAYQSNGQMEEAMREYETIIQGPYKADQVYYSKIRLASALIEVGQLAEARGKLKELQDVSPGDEAVVALERQLNERQAQL